MSLFKKKISVEGFLSKQIILQFYFWENNFTTVIDTIDEVKVLTDEDKRDFLDKIPELAMANLIMDCSYHLGRKMAREDVAVNVLIGYGVYLTEIKEMSQEAAEQRKKRLREFLALVGEAEEWAQTYDEECKETGYQPLYRCKTDIDKVRRALGLAFARYCVGTDLNSENYLPRQRAALGLAGKAVCADIVGLALKEYSIRL